MVGGTFGVAALGALVTRWAATSSTTCCPQRRHGRCDQLADALGAGRHRRPAPPSSAAMDDAFVHALQGGMRLGAAVALVGAFVAAATISSGVGPQLAREPAAERRARARPPAERAPRRPARGRPR